MILTVLIQSTTDTNILKKIVKSIAICVSYLYILVLVSSNKTYPLPIISILKISSLFPKKLNQKQ